MIKGNQTFDGTVGITTTDNTLYTHQGSLFAQDQSKFVQDQRHKEIVLLLQVQFPDVYTKIMDALRARDALQGKHTW
jgi:hypothetical protein